MVSSPARRLFTLPAPANTGTTQACLNWNLAAISTNFA